MDDNTQKLLCMSMKKIENIKNQDNMLCRTVLIKKTIKRLQKELLEEKQFTSLKRLSYHEPMLPPPYKKRLYSIDDYPYHTIDQNILHTDHTPYRSNCNDNFTSDIFQPSERQLNPLSSKDFDTTSNIMKLSSSTDKSVRESNKNQTNCLNNVSVIDNECDMKINESEKQTSIDIDIVFNHLIKILSEN